MPDSQTTISNKQWRENNEYDVTVFLFLRLLSPLPNQSNKKVKTKQYSVLITAPSFFSPSSLFRTLTLLNKNPWTFLKHFYFIVPMTSEEQLEIKKNAEKKILFYPVFKQINTIFLHWLIFFIISLLIFKNFFFLSSFEFYVCEWLLLLFLQQ